MLASTAEVAQSNQTSTYSIQTSGGYWIPVDGEGIPLWPACRCTDREPSFDVGDGIHINHKGT